MRFRKIIIPLATVLLIIFVLGTILYNVFVLKSVKRNFKYDKSLDVSEELQKLLYYAELAPSSHNAQMWKVKVLKDDATKKEVDVILNDKRALKEVDPENREGYISLGTFVENLVEAAEAEGYSTNAKINSTIGDDGKAISIYMNMEGKTKENKDLLKLIENRSTVRKSYSKEELKEKDIKGLESIDENSVTYFPLKGEKGKYISDSLIKANIQQANNEKRQEEFSNYVRFSKGQAESKKDGVTPTGMGLSGIKRFFVSVFMNKNSVMSKSFIDQTKATVTKQVENCGGFIVITSNDNSFQGLCNSGRVLEKFWLEAENLKVAVHPMSQLMEESPWKENINNKLQISQPIQMILRAGYYDKPVTIDSERLDLKDIITH